MVTQRLALFSNMNKRDEENDFNPFNIRLGKGEAKKQEPGAFSKLKSFLSQKLPSSSPASSEGRIKPPAQKEAGGETEKVGLIVEMIEKHLNRRHFNEKKLEQFFDLCFSLKERTTLMQNPRFIQFVEADLKMMLQSVHMVENFAGFSKFLVFFRVDQDPELYEYLAKGVKKNIKRFTVDEMLTILVNFSFSLSTETSSLFDEVNYEFVERLGNNFNPETKELLIQHEDYVKLLNTLLDHRRMTEELKSVLLEHLLDNHYSIPYEIWAEVAVIFATKMDETYKKTFFNEFKEKFMKELKHLKSETMYKIVWALAKSNAIIISEQGSEWTVIKEAIIHKADKLDAKTLVDLLVLSTVAKNEEYMDQEKKVDLFDSLETQLILMMKEMQLGELVSLWWSGQEIGKGSAHFYSRLEQEITDKIYQVQEADLQTIIECFTEGQSTFSEKFLDMVVGVVRKKKEELSLTALIHLIWAFSKVNSASSFELLQELKEYPRLVESLDSMKLKSLCILLWTFTKDARLQDVSLAVRIVEAILSFQGQFELDNFDLLLLVQSIMHLEASQLLQDYNVTSRIYQLVGIVETFGLKHLDLMNVQEFTTLALFYLNRFEAASPQMKEKLLQKITDSVSSFNELQLQLLRQGLKQMGDLGEGQVGKLGGECLEKVEEELEGIGFEKKFIGAEELIREAIRDKIKLTLEKRNKEISQGFKEHQSEFDDRLEQPVPVSRKSKEKLSKERKDEEEVSKKLDEQQEGKKDEGKQEEQPAQKEDEVEKLKKYLLNRKKNNPL